MKTIIKKFQNKIYIIFLMYSYNKIYFFLQTFNQQKIIIIINIHGTNQKKKKERENGHKILYIIKSNL